MPRISLPPVADLGAAAGALSPEIWAGNRAYSRAVYSHSQLPAREFEAARLRIAQINGCARCLDLRLVRDLPGRADRSEPIPDSFYDAVEHWREAPEAFSEREWLAIEFADRFATDHVALSEDDAFWRRMSASFADSELVDLGLSAGAFLAGGRFHHVFGTDAVCPVPTKELLETSVS
jgi:alkylhydroperoxidase family enzyme